MNSAGEPKMDDGSDMDNIRSYESRRPRNSSPAQTAASRRVGQERARRDAAAVMAGVNDLLQREIDRAKETTGPLPQLGRQLNSLTPDQTQAFAEAVVRILNEQARKAEEQKPVGESPRQVQNVRMQDGFANGTRQPAVVEQMLVAEDELPPISIEGMTEDVSEQAEPKSVPSQETTAPEPVSSRQASAPEPAQPRQSVAPEPVQPQLSAQDVAQSAAQEPVQPGQQAAQEAPGLQPQADRQQAAGGTARPQASVLPEPKVREYSLSGQTPQPEEPVVRAQNVAEAYRQEPDERMAEDDYDEPDDFGSGEEDIEIPEEQFTDAIYDELPQTELTEEERELFTYFTPITGMEAVLCQVLTGVRARLMSDGKPVTGNVIVQGGEGTGKTTLATSLISVLQREVGRPNGSVGKIDGDRLNTKDLSKLFGKIRGGALIIERAGDITRDTALELSAQMEQDESGILVILEDARIGIERVMALNPMFSRRFTEKIVIPVLTIDELVNFGKAYAMELGYSIDEMGVLAMYDRINLIQRTDHPTNLTEVKEIVDEAIDLAEGGGIRGFLGRFGGRHFDQDGNLILQEKDFQGR